MVALPELVEGSPAAADLALLEGTWRRPRIAAAGLGGERDFGVFARGDDGRIIAGAGARVLRGCRRCGLRSRYGGEGRRVP